MKIKQLISVVFPIFVLMACSDRPSYVLSEGKMEKVLFDLYVAEAEIANRNTAYLPDSTFKRELLNSVLKKHKIAESDLDTSLFWYNQNLDKYLKINDRLKVRYSQMLEALRPNPVEIPSDSLRDNIYFPVATENFFLTVKDLPQHVYAFKADTTLESYGGEYRLQFEVLGITPEIHPIIAFCIEGADTIYVKRDTLDRNGSFASSIVIPQEEPACNLFGTIYFPEIRKEMSVFIYKLELLQKKQSD